MKKKHKIQLGKSILTIFFTILFFYIKAQDILPETSYKYAVIKSVCEKISAAKGDNKPIPQIVIQTSKSASKVIASYQSKPIQRIIVDEFFYDLTRKFGKDSLNALACVLGHELYHYYDDDTWTNSFLDLIEANNGTGNQYSDTSKRIEIETKADHFGLFYGYVAGYENYKIYPQVLTEIYKDYKLKDQILGYPSKTQRIANAEEAVNEINKWVSVFRIAQFEYIYAFSKKIYNSSIKEDYDLALESFKYLLLKFPSKEIYNNIATILLKEASFLISSENKKELLFSYPFEFDSRTRLSTKDRSFITVKEDPQLLLKEAKNYLEKAILIDKDYVPAIVNLACLYSISGNPNYTIGLIKEYTDRTDTNKLSGDGLLIRAIAYTTINDFKNAEKDFISAKGKNAFNVDFNYSIFQKIKNGDSINEAMLDSIYSSYYNIGKKIDNKKEKLDFLKTLYSLTYKDTVKFKFNDTKVFISRTELEDYCITKAETGDYSIDYTIVETKEEKQLLTDKSLQQNADYAELISVYGTPDNSINATDSDIFLFYDDAQIIFELKNNRVNKWIIYK